MKEDAFWDIFISWMPNKKLSFAAAYTRFGNIVDKDVDFLYSMQNTTFKLTHVN